MPTIKEIKGYVNSEVESTFFRKLNKTLAVYPAKLLLYTSITGNQVSLLIGIIAVIASILLAFGEFWYSIFAILLLIFQRNLDYVDGLIARYRGAASIRGIYVDLVTSSITSPLAFLGLTIGIFRTTDSLVFLIFGMLAVLFSHLSDSVQHLKHQGLVMKLSQYAKGKNIEELKNKNLEIPTSSKSSHKRSLLKKLGLAILMALVPVYMPAILLIALIFNVAPWVLVLYGIALPLKWLVLVFYEFKTNYTHLEHFFKPYQPK